MAGVQIPIEAKFDASDVDKVLAQLTAEVNKLGSTVASANKVRFNPIDKSSMADLQRMQAQFDSLLKISADFRKRIQHTGQEGADFFELKWEQLYPDANVRARKMRERFDYVTAGTGVSFTAPSPSPGGQYGTDDTVGKREWDRKQGGGSGGGSGGGGNGSPASSWGSAGRKILSSGLRASGSGGAAAAGAIEGLASGLTGPMIIGNLIAQGISAIASAVKAKIGDAQQLDVGYDTLKRQLGDVGVGFNALKTSLSNASWGFSATYEETLKVAEAFTRAAGTFGKDSKTLAGEVEVAGGFARSYGIDPSRAGAFFGQMRQTGVTSDENGSKRLALMIGETVAKSGTSAKMDEVLAAIAGFTQQQARLGMAPANVSGFLGEFAGMANTGPGTDAQSIANLLGTVNSAIQRGGNSGEAGQNFMYAALGKQNGLDPIQTKILEEQGMFGTMGGTFGAGSEWQTFAKKYHVQSPSLGAQSGQMSFTSLMESFRTQYARNPELMLNAMSNTFGISHSQAMKLADVDPVSVDGAASRLARLHLDLSKVNATGIERLTHIDSDKTLSDSEKDKQFKEVYDKNQEKTQGSEIRDGLTGVSKVITDMADKLVPLTTTIMNSVVYIAGGGKKSQRQIQEANNQAEHDDAVGQIDAVADEKRKAAREAKKEYNAKRFDLESTIKDPRSTPGDRKDAADELYRLSTAADTTGVDADQKNGRLFEDERLAQKNRQTQGRSTPATNPMFLAELAQDDKDLGLSPGMSQSIMMTESSGDASATNDNANGTVDRGLFQINSDLLHDLTPDFLKAHGRAPNPYDPEDSRDLKNMQMKKLMKKFNGDQSKAVRAYHLGAGANLSSEEGDRYMHQIDRNTPVNSEAPKLSIASAPIPSDADTKAASANGGAQGTDKPVNVRVSVDNHHTFNMPGGAAPQVNTLSTAWGSPTPAGVGG